MITTIVSFFVSVLGVNFLTNVYKTITTRYSATEIRFAAFVLALIAACLMHFFGMNQGVLSFMETAGGIFTSAMTFYHLVLQGAGKTIPAIGDLDLSA